MTYDLFDIESMNLIDSFGSLDEALATVRATMRAHGVEAIATWGLFPNESDEPAISGDKLVALAQAGISV
jgi:hypothetical protein